MSALVITVDGSSGSGKTTLGRRLAARFGLRLIDTGLVYRGITVAAVRAGIDATEPQRLADLARTTSLEVNTSSDIEPSWQLRVDGVEAGALLRDPHHAILLSSLSQVAEVRAALLHVQRELAGDGAVAVGRDCGTVVFPDARVKLFLDADSGVRMQRREAQLRAAGLDGVDAGALAADVRGRDRLDAPSMQPANDAVVIDTGSRDADAVFAEALLACSAAGI